MDLLGLATSINVPVVSAFALGLLTAISPCPMATNIAAIAYISRQVSNRKYAVTTGAVYTLGRMFSYSLLGILIIVTGMEIPGVSTFLQNVGERVIGPILIIVGLVLLFIDRLTLGHGSSRLSVLGGKFAGWGIIGGFPLGIIFALAFCPYSAVLFFAVLIPLALGTPEGTVLPAVYAIGTGLPVLIFGTLFSTGIAGVSSWLNAITRVERIIRVVVALTFVGVGIYYVVLWIQS